MIHIHNTYPHKQPEPGAWQIRLGYTSFKTRIGNFKLSWSLFFFFFFFSPENVPCSFPLKGPVLYCFTVVLVSSSSRCLDAASLDMSEGILVTILKGISVLGGRPEGSIFSAWKAV